MESSILRLEWNRLLRTAGARHIEQEPLSRTLVFSSGVAGTACDAYRWPRGVAFDWRRIRLARNAARRERQVNIRSRHVTRQFLSPQQLSRKETAAL